MAELQHNKFVGYRIYEAHRALTRRLEKMLSPFGITPGEWNALNQLSHYGAMSQRSLAEALRKEQATITRGVDRMVRKGLVTREPDPNDRRANVITPTAYALDLLKQIEPFAAESASDSIKGIAEDELEAFTATLRKIRQNVEPEDA